MNTFRPIADWSPSTPDARGSDLQVVTRHHAAVVVHFWAVWNGTDPPMDDRIQAVAEKFADRVHFVSCNIDLPENREFCLRLGIATIPTLAVFVAGELRGFVIGLCSADQLAGESKLCCKSQRSKPFWKFWRRNQFPL